MQLIDKLDLDENTLQLLTSKQGRIARMRNDPLLFAFYYLRHHVTEPDMNDMITLSEFHIALLEYAQSWIDGAPARTAFIAARNGGKSTWLHTILPIWAAAMGHQKFIVGFSDSASQARDHLRTFKKELDENDALRADFPDFCKPKYSAVSGRASTYNDNMIQMSNGFIFIAKGADTSALGLKVGNTRPSLIIADDLEGGESSYSDVDIKKRLRTFIDDILPLNVFAQVVLVGTTTRLGSIMDQVRTVTEERAKHPEYTDKDMLELLPAELHWVIREKFSCYYYPAILDEHTENERSAWPEKFPMSWINEVRDQPSFKKNYMNRPVSMEESFWADNDISVEHWSEYGSTIISIDPAVTTNKKSDFTGIAVISRGVGENKDRLCIRHIEEVKMSPDALGKHIELMIEEYGATIVYVETNMGGDLWDLPFKGLKAKVISYRSKENKSKRAESAFYWYQQGQVVHEKSMPAAENQMKAFPAVVHDDMVDALSSGINSLLKKKNKAGASAFVYKYQ